ncbi:hypothetical protein OIU78_006986 [Salix suchowensis]|nr:hypothetical protein OIU78_006986 [Salix suchowensis]
MLNRTGKETKFELIEYLHSTPLQFQCRDKKKMPGNPVYFLWGLRFNPDREETMTKRRGSPTASTTLFTLLIFLLTTKRLRVVDVNLANGSCSLPYKSVSVEEVMDDSRYRLHATTYASFIKCSRILLGLILNGLFGCWYSSFSYDCSRSDYYHSPWFDALYLVWNFLSVIFFVGRFILAPIGIFGFLVHKYMTTKKAFGNEEEERKGNDRSFDVETVFWGNTPTYLACIIVSASRSVALQLLGLLKQ